MNLKGLSVFKFVPNENNHLFNMTNDLNFQVVEARGRFRVFYKEQLEYCIIEN